MSYGNGTGGFVAPTFTNGTNKWIIWLTYAIYFLNASFGNIILLNFVIALISAVYEKVMNFKMKHIY